MKREEIRFAVGEAGNQASPVWRLWGQKNDVYLAVRTVVGFIKMSLHAPSEKHPAHAWIIANTTESGVALKDRRMKRWSRPPETVKGWTWGPRIAVPITANYDFKIDEQVAKPVEWIPAPPVGTMVSISLGFAEPELTMEKIEEICGKDRYGDDYLELDNLEKVLVAVRYDPLVESDRPYIAQLEAQAKQIIDVNKDDVKGFVAHWSKDLDVPFVCTIKFGTSRDGPW